MKNNTFYTGQEMTSEFYEFHHYRQDTIPFIDFHSHDFYEIYLFIDGTVTYCIEEMTFEMMNGDILIIPPGKLHKPVITDGMSYERIVLWLNADYIRSLDDSQNSIFDELKRLRDSGQLLINLKESQYRKAYEMLSEMENTINSENNKKDIICRAYITLLLLQLILISNNQQEKNKSSENESIVPKIIEYINENLTEKLSSDSIAEQFFISKYHLHHIFKEYTNVSLYDYILSKRIILAKSLIRHGSNITDACFSCGFKDYSNFYKTFIAKTGISPKEFKNSLKNR